MKTIVRVVTGVLLLQLGLNVGYGYSKKPLPSPTCSYGEDDS